MKFIFDFLESKLNLRCKASETFNKKEKYFHYNFGLIIFVLNYYLATED